MKPGNTPLVEFREMAPEGTQLFCKLEWYNPTGSIKDRAAWFMFHNAVRDNLIPGKKPLVEATSGNTGIGLARIALINGHPMVICLPKRASEERKQLLKAYGAELIEVDGGPNDAIARAREIVAEGEAHMLYQYGNPSNPEAHELGTVPEIVQDWPNATPPDHVFCAYGTGGTITGVSRGLKKNWPSVAVHSVEEIMDDPISGMRSQDDPFQPPVGDLSLVDYRFEATNATAVEAVTEIMKLEGHFVGTSSGAIVRAAQTVLSERGGTAVAVLPDAGWKYLSSAPWK